MKRFLNFQGISKKREQSDSSLNTSSLPKVVPSRGETSPTTLRRPTARNAAEPWQLLDVLATPDALLIRPRHGSQAVHLKVAWGKSINVTEVKSGRNDLDWELNALPIHGIVGMMTLFSGGWSPMPRLDRLIRVARFVYSRHHWHSRSGKSWALFLLLWVTLM
jgi:hypothetical protein